MQRVRWGSARFARSVSENFLNVLNLQLKIIEVDLIIGNKSCSIVLRLHLKKIGFRRDFYHDEIVTFVSLCDLWESLPAKRGWSKNESCCVSYQMIFSKVNRLLQCKNHKKSAQDFGDTTSFFLGQLTQLLSGVNDKY